MVVLALYGLGMRAEETFTLFSIHGQTVKRFNDLIVKQAFTYTVHSVT
jgi:hypothetical protein